MTARGTSSARIAALAGAVECPHCDRKCIAGMPHNTCLTAVDLAAERSKGEPDAISRYVDAHGKAAGKARFTVAYSSVELSRAFEARHTNTKGNL